MSKPKLYDVVVTTRGFSPITLMKVIRGIAGDNPKQTAVPSTLKDAKEFVDALLHQPKTLLHGVALGVAQLSVKRIEEAGASAKSGRSETNFTEAKKRPPKKMKEQEALDSRQSNSAAIRGDTSSRECGVKPLGWITPCSDEPGHSGRHSHARYSNRGKELLSSKVFREHILKLVGLYCIEAVDLDGPGWAEKFGKVEDIALDFVEFITALGGEVK